MDDLTFKKVSEANRVRCTRWHPGFPADDSWTGADWSNAMCGEAGELANVVKKLRRIETGHDPNPLKPEQTEAWLLDALGDECADVFLYLDLLAQKYGVNLPAAIVRKFNEVSIRQGSPDRLTLGATTDEELRIVHPAPNGPDVLRAVAESDRTTDSSRSSNGSYDHRA